MHFVLETGHYVMMHALLGENEGDLARLTSRTIEVDVDLEAGQSQSVPETGVHLFCLCKHSLSKRYSGVYYNTNIHGSCSRILYYISKLT